MESYVKLDAKEALELMKYINLAQLEGMHMNNTVERIMDRIDLWLDENLAYGD